MFEAQFPDADADASGYLAEILCMRHVWLLNHYAQDPGSAGGTRHYHLAEKLMEFGWRVWIIASSVEYYTGRQRLVPGEASRLEVVSDVPFLWVRTPQYEGNGGGRIINMLTYTGQVLRPSITKMLPRPDLIIGSSVHPFAAMAGCLLARKFNVPFIFEVRDLWPQTLVDMGRLSHRSLIARAMRRLELFLYRRSSSIVVLLPHAWEYIADLGIPRERVVWVPNGVDLSLFPRINAPVGEISQGFTLMYLGAHGRANGLDIVLTAMKEVQSDPKGKQVRLRMIGDGPLKSFLVAKANMLGLTNVSFEQSVPKAQIPGVAAQADAFVLSVMDLPKLYRYGISMNKLYDYMAASRPIIIAANSGNNPVKDAGAGITVPPEDSPALARAILDLASTPLDERRKMGRLGRIYVEENHDFRYLAQRLAEVLDEVYTARP